MASMKLHTEEFDVDKALAAVTYLVDKTEATMYSVMKMLYLADKMHLDRYGRFISGDSYVAMQQGPVPSFTYDMVKHVRGDDSRGTGGDRAIECIGYELPSHRIVLKDRPDMEELSDSDIECLDEICAIYKGPGKWAVRDMSHDDAWRNIWERTPRRVCESKAVAMPLEAIVAELDNAESLLEYLRDPHPGDAGKGAVAV